MFLLQEKITAGKVANSYKILTEENRDYPAGTYAIYQR